MNEEISIRESNSGLSGKENELFTDVCQIIDGVGNGLPLISIRSYV